MSNESKYDVFLSYARHDDEPFVKQLYNELSANSYRVWWDRACMPNRALKFTQEIRDAVEKSDRLLLIIGPRAMASDYVRYEWQHALLFAKGVVPILRLGKRDVLPTELRAEDYKLLPPEISKYHCPDFRDPRLFEEAFEELLRILEEPIPELGSFLTLVPALPPHLFSRSYDIDGLTQAVLSDIERPTVITSSKQTTALQGMGGIGKSVLAAVFARATNTRRAFTDGIIWLHIGQDPDQFQVFRQVAAALDENLSDYLELPVARSRLPQLLERKVCLIVLDDVWDVDPIKPLRDALGPRCRLLITTRHSDIIAALGAQEHSLDLLSKDEATSHLANWAGVLVEELPDAARTVVERCGHLPLALSLCGAHVRAGTLLSDLLDALRAAELEFLDHPHGSVFLSIKVSFNALSESDRQRYLELAVFPVGVTVPEVAVITLWDHTGQLKGRHARQLLGKLRSRALLNIDGNTSNRRISLHDLQHDYLRTVLGDLTGLHKALLVAYRKKCPQGWPSGPNDGYFFQHLTYHLIKAARWEELHDTLTDFSFLEQKVTKVGLIERTDVSGNVVKTYAGVLLLQDDFVQALKAMLAEPKQSQNWATIAAFHQALTREAHVLTGRPDLLWQQLYNRLQWENEPVQILLKQEYERRSKGIPQPFFRTLSIFRESKSLLRTLKGHTFVVTCCSISQDGKLIVSAGYENALRIWDVATGEERAKLLGHTSTVEDCTFSPDGSTVLSASHDKSLKLWNVQSGALEKSIEWPSFDTFKGEMGWLKTCAYSPDGTKIMAASDTTIRIWDAKTGEEWGVLEGHRGKVFASFFNPDGSIIISADEFKIKVWEAHSLKEIVSIDAHSINMIGLDISPDGTTIVSGSNDRTMKLWDVDSHAMRTKIEVGSERPANCRFSPDGSKILASTGSVLKLWDSQSGQEVGIFEGHTGSIFDCTFSPDGNTVVSASHDATLKIWDVTADSCLPERDSHQAAVRDCAFNPDGSLLVTASYDKTLRIWDVSSRETKVVLVGHEREIEACDFDPDGLSIFSGSWYDLRLWDSVSGREVALFAGSLSVSSGVFSPDGCTIATVYRLDLSNTPRLWNPQTRRHLADLEKHPEPLNSCTFSPDGCYLLTGCHDGILRLWDIRTGRKVSTFRGHEGPVLMCAFDPSGRKIASASHDKTVRIWDVELGEQIAVFKGHKEEVVACTFSPDGSILVSSGADECLKIWHMEGLNAMASMVLPGHLNCIECHPTRPLIAGGDNGGNIHFIEIIGVKYGPIIVTPGDGGEGFIIRCPFCNNRIPFQDEWHDKEMPCPIENCGELWKVNTFKCRQQSWTRKIVLNNK